jgi:hypothetical protein
LWKFYVPEKIGSANRKSTHCHTCGSSANITSSESLQICGFAICGTYLRTAHYPKQKYHGEQKENVVTNNSAPFPSIFPTKNLPFFVSRLTKKIRLARDAEVSFENITFMNLNFIWERRG